MKYQSFIDKQKKTLNRKLLIFRLEFPLRFPPARSKVNYTPHGATEETEQNKFDYITKKINVVHKITRVIEHFVSNKP